MSAPLHFPWGSSARPIKPLPLSRPGDRCDKCDLHISEWNENPVCEGATITQSPRHTITRFHIPIPDPNTGTEQK